MASIRLITLYGLPITAISVPEETAIEKCAHLITNVRYLVGHGDVEEAEKLLEEQGLRLTEPIPLVKPMTANEMVKYIGHTYKPKEDTT